MPVYLCFGIFVEEMRFEDYNADMISYLIKFVSKEKNADSLLNGDLFMRCAYYYHDLERKKGRGQGDIWEAMAFPGLGIYTHADLPIYCLYTVEETEIADNTIRIPNLVIQDFGCEQGYLVLIDFYEFEKALPVCDTHGYQMNGRSVIYGTPSEELSRKFFADDPGAMNLFVKSEAFSHQKEYRLVVYHPIPWHSHMEMMDGMEVRVCDTDEMNVTYSIPGGIHDIARKFAVASLTKTETEYLLHI